MPQALVVPIMAVAQIDSALLNTISALRRHFDEIILPLWLGPGFNVELGLPFEALDSADGQPVTPVRYRAMACARQLYVYAGTPGKVALQHADQLFLSLLRYFQNTEQGGWRYSVDAQGRPLDDTQDLYTHAFVVYACAAYFLRSRNASARQVMLNTVSTLEKRFRSSDDTSYNAVLSADWTQVLKGPAQNPMMHLTEAYLVAAQVAEPVWFASALRRICLNIAREFTHPRSQCITEEPQGSAANWVEPGHQFEWFSLVNQAGEVLSGQELSLSVPRAWAWAREYGVARDSQGVCAILDEQGAVQDSTQRIWAQAEYARVLALSRDWDALAVQLKQFQARFLHAGGWYECLDAQGRVTRRDMPSTTPYHLMTCYAALPGGA